jgi:8-oxo-dGTP pyrophosphatase MutT (NUDIX family)
MSSSDSLPAVLRTFDSDGYRLRAGCICFASPACGEELGGKILLASSASKKDGWVVPAGGIDPGEAPQEAALRELHEEAGAVAAPESARLLCWVTDDRKRTRTAVFLVSAERLVDEYAESALRSRRWVSIDEARALLLPSPGQALVFNTAMEAVLAQPALALGLVAVGAPAAVSDSGDVSLVSIACGAAEA